MLQIKHIYKEYKTGELIQKALDGVNFNLRDNEFVAILGPSGSGKTTLLNIIGGLDRYDRGDLIINGISTKNYKDRDWDSYRNHTIGFVFQSYNLIPHQSLLSNVELALTISGISKSERKQRALHALDQVGLKSQAHKKPNQLSGGQMQRVAIARALVNDPDILLADEPTGALDSDTSLQVMDLLKEVAKDRLVVMVTHNPELAQSYATRIITLKDGVIINDSDPYLLDENQLSVPEHKNMGKASMSFLTALALSFNNLKTKKGRTLLTSFAGSIGIIGIALILSLSNGVNSYIKTIEEETLSEYPLQIQSTGINMTSMLADFTAPNEDKAEDEIQIREMITGMFSKIGSNDLISLKHYLEEDGSHIEAYTRAIEYKYNVVPQIYSIQHDQIHQVNPDSSFAVMGLGSSNSSNSMMSTMMSTDVFAAMPDHTELFVDQYDVKAGHWPQNKNECVLVLTSSGGMSDFMLYTLGLRDYSELEEMVKQFAANENVTTPSDFSSYTYQDILGITFKVVAAYERYEYDEEYQIWKNKEDDDAFMEKRINEGEDLVLVGIVQPKEQTNAAMLTSGIYYPTSLVHHLIEEAKESAIVQQQLAFPTLNVFTNTPFGEERENTFDMSSLFSINTGLLQNAFSIDESKLQFDRDSLDQILSQVTLPPLDLNELLSQIQIDIPDDALQLVIASISDQVEKAIREQIDLDLFQQQIESYLVSDHVNELVRKEIEGFIQENGSLEITPEQLQQLIEILIDDYTHYAAANDWITPTQITDALSNYIASDAFQDILVKEMTALFDIEALENQMTTALQTYMNSITDTLSSSFQEAIASGMQDLGASMADAIHFDSHVFAQAIEIKMDENELNELFASMMSKQHTTLDSNLKELGYADFDKPYRIDIYPKDFESKEQILQILDQYNDDVKATGQEDKAISYTDYVGTLMSSVTDIINVISYVLIAFVAISLVVSSIMIGVITYISVLERKKEIGILRAIGASKHNISQVFNAETIIIGFSAGFMGIAITLLLLIPGNALIHSIAGQDNISAVMPMSAGIILILLSVILTLIGGILPSKKAANEDPVIALRTE